MEQASVQLPAALEREQAKPDTQPQRPGFLRRNLGEAGVRLSLAWVCLAASIGATGLAQDTEHEQVTHAEPKIGQVVDGPPTPLDYSPVTDVDEVHGGNDAVQRDAKGGLAAFNHSVDVMKPDGRAKGSYESFFHTPSVHVKRPPALREAIHIQDSNTFSDIEAAHPDTYPFTIYNATGRPIDLLFVNYAIRATQLWLNETNGGDHPDIDINGHTLAEADRITDPHIMIFTNRIPAGARGEIFSATEGVTMTQPGNLTRSFIKNNGSTSEPFLREAVATEICQSMVNVADERVVPGKDIQQKLMRRHAGSFNKPALHDLDLASQESVCNGLGNFVTAAYEGGHGLRQVTMRHAVIPNTALTHGIAVESTWIDYGLYRPEQRQFEWLAKHIIWREYNEVIGAQDAHTPTLDYYRHHNSYLPN